MLIYCLSNPSNNIYIGLVSFIVTFGWYLFQLIVHLKHDFNGCSNFAFSWVDKVIAGTQSFASVNVNFVAPFAAEITQSADQVRTRLIS